MENAWCGVCCTMHDRKTRCPGELNVEEVERHGWRVNVETPHGIEAYGILIGLSEGGLWRARILTYPNVLWVIPGGGGTMKFVAESPIDAERQAIEFVRAHCRDKGLRFRNEVSLARPDAMSPDEELDCGKHAPATRMIRFLPIRFGVVNATEIGGTGNLSETGVFVITNHPVGVNIRLRLLLDLDNQPIALTGDVRWMNSEPRVGRSPGMGVRLHTPPDAYIEYVKTLG